MEFREDPPDSVVEALSDDLNSGQLFAELHALAKDRKIDQLLGSLHLIGFSGKAESIGILYMSARATAKASGMGVVSLSVSARATAKASGMGVVSLSVSPPEIDRLLSARNAARAAKNWAESDRIRDELLGMGVALKDNKDGTTTCEVKR